MNHKRVIKTVWAILGIYGIWFAVLSGLEEAISGKFWKVALALILALAVLSYSKDKN
jgi:hypothetical protein